MDHTYWHKQTATQPLFPDLLWSRPENKRHAGKLLIIGGNAHGFREPAAAYAASTAAGAGSVRVLLPDALAKTITGVFPEAFFAPSTQSGSFAQQALDTWLELAEWADGVLLAGDFGRNSETAIVLEQFLAKYSGLVVAAGDAIDYFTAHAAPLLDRAAPTVLCLQFSQLQKLASSSRFRHAFTSDMPLLQLVETLHDFTTEHSAQLCLAHRDHIYTAGEGTVHTTPVHDNKNNSPTHAAVWAIQHPHAILHAITTSLIA